MMKTILFLALTVWVQATVAAQTATPAGSPTSDCLASPCTLTRGLALLNNNTLSTLTIEPGYYSQAALTLSGHGKVIVQKKGAILTSTRKFIPPEQWELAPGTLYTYRAAHLQSEFNSSNPAQRAPTNWTPIVVRDSAIADKEITLTFPPRMRNATSIAEVEKQAGTHYDDATHVYVHMLHDGPPTAADDLWLASTGHGSVTVTGDNNLWVGLTMHHVAKSNGNGLDIAAGADGNVFRNATLEATGATIRANAFVMEDSAIGHSIMQGPAGNKGCYDTTPTVGIGECWNQSGLGSAVDFLVTTAGGSFRRNFVHRSWNGLTMCGANTFEDNLLWGFPNHTSSLCGTGVKVRRNVFLNGQDSLYVEGSNFDQVEVTQNTFVNGVLFWVSRDGKGGIAPTSWTFSHNIVSTFVLDDRTFPGLKADCNVFIRPFLDPQADLFRITPTDGGGFTGSWNTLTAWQAATAGTATGMRDASSAELDAAHWTNGTQFKQFTNNALPFDFHPVPGAQALAMPCGTYAGAYGFGR